MRPKRSADYRVLLWVLVMPLVMGAQYVNPALIPYLAWVGAYLALSAGVMAHNHNHCPTFDSRRANSVFGHILSLFYGYPTFAWIPTHNLNHHKFVNRAGDATITWRHTNKHNLLVAFSYFFVSSYWQSDPIKAFIRKARTGNRRLYAQIMFQYALWSGVGVALLGVAMLMHGWKEGLRVWALASVLPAVFALWAIMLFNYIQHVHTDPWSPHNHSRNFSGRLTNFFLFNNGLHGVHHENPGTHWSQLPALHAAFEPHVDPRLVHRSFWWFCLSNYFLAPLFPSLGTKQVGRAPFDPPTGGALDLTSADVPIAEPGANAQMMA